MANNLSLRVRKFLTRIVIYLWLKRRLWALKTKMAHDLNLLARDHNNQSETLFGGILVLHTIISLLPDDLLKQIPFTEEISVSVPSRFETVSDLMARLKELTTRLTVITKEMSVEGSRRSGFNLNRSYENESDKNYGFFVQEIGGTVATVNAIQAQVVLILGTRWYDVMSPTDVAYLDRQTVLLVKDLSTMIQVVVDLVFSLKPEHF